MRREAFEIPSSSAIIPSSSASQTEITTYISQFPEDQKYSCDDLIGCKPRRWRIYF